jgi:hypothetical protein
LRAETFLQIADFNHASWWRERPARALLVSTPSRFIRR